MSDSDLGPKPPGSSPGAGEAWSKTNEERKAIAEERRADGWEVASMPAVHTSPVSKDQGDDDRFGLVHIIPDNYADEFAAAYDRGSFPEYLAYRNEIHNSAFLVTEHMDPDSRTVIVIASHYDLRLAAGMIRSAKREGVLHTYVKTVDGTELGSFTHEEYEPLIPTSDDPMPIPDESGTTDRA